MHFGRKAIRRRRELVHRAYYDDVTGAKNLFRVKLDAPEIMRKNPKACYAVVVVDVKDFQMFNDQYGFETGDVLLRTIAKTLEDTLDSAYETSGRVEGDVFVILVALDDDGSLLDRENKLLTQLVQAAKDAVGRGVPFVMGSCIISHADAFTSSFENARFAHKHAKASGRVIAHYDDALKKIIQREKYLENRMEQALVDGEFKLFLQPQYSVNDEVIESTEALVRWIPPDGNMVYPDEFIPLFERNGFIQQLDYFMFEQACRKLKEWIDAGIEPVTIAVNFSRAHLDDPDWIPTLARTASIYKIPAGLLEIELTERTAIEKESELRAALSLIHAEGFKISIDDFGSGYSSLGALNVLEVDTLKLDKSFFDAGPDNKRMRAIVASVIRMAKQLNMETVAEGIEEEEQVIFLRELKCDKIQGYYYARPQPADDIVVLLRRQ
ncbi:MAG: GGDEF domain-containing phosphodiesterase [Gordonibacter sp.]|nr:GGDEF domain-containing phosphodiesterase [Gordonibacter sp.]